MAVGVRVVADDFGASTRKGACATLAAILARTFGLGLPALIGRIDALHDRLAHTASWRRRAT